MAIFSIPAPPATALLCFASHDMMSSYLTVVKFLKRPRPYTTSARNQLFFKGRFTLVDSLDTPTEQEFHRKALANLISDAHTNSTLDGKTTEQGFIGIDTETKPAMDKGAHNHTTLLQLSARNSCVMYRLHKLNHRLPKELLDLLEDATLLKVGIGIIHDMTTLAYEQEQINAIRGCVDLDVVSRTFPELTRTSEQGFKLNHGLASLSDLLFQKEEKPSSSGGGGGASGGKDVFDGIPYGGGKFIKNKSISMSNWSQNKLTTKQLNYAASDAWIAYEMAEALSMKVNRSTTHVKHTTTNSKQPNSTATTQCSSFQPTSIVVSTKDVWPKRALQLIDENSNTMIKNVPPPPTVQQPNREDIIQSVAAFANDNDRTSGTHLALSKGLTPKTRWLVHQYVATIPNLFSASTGHKGKSSGRARVMHLFKFNDKETKEIDDLLKQTYVFMNDYKKLNRGQKRMKFEYDIGNANMQKKQQNELYVPLSEFAIDMTHYSHSDFDAARMLVLARVVENTPRGPRGSTVVAKGEPIIHYKVYRNVEKSTATNGIKLVRIQVREHGVGVQEKSDEGKE